MNEINGKKKCKLRHAIWVILPLCGLMLLLIAGTILVSSRAASHEAAGGLAISDLVASAAARDESRVELSIKGNAQFTLEYGDVFRDPGAEAFGYGTVLHKKGQALDIHVDSKVDPEKLGVYTVAYSAEFMGITETAIRTVTVVDSCKPVITLTSDPDTYTLPGAQYREEGFTATDNYDGDITDRVERRAEGDKVIYTVTDSSGNRTQVERTIRYHDPVAPELMLKGEQKISINAGTKWTDPGYTATDNVDGDLTAKVTVSGKVDCFRAGTYDLTYEVTDGYGNKAYAKRTVTVHAMQQPDVVVPEGKVIYLTFDDGPSQYTAELLATLEKYNVKATFFVVNTTYLDLLDDIVEGGHSIGVHTKTHRYEKIYSSEENYFEDLYAMQDIIYQHTGVKTMLMRFPGGSGNHSSIQYNQGIMTRLTQAVQDQGFRFFDWNVTSGDAGGTEDTDGVIDNVIMGIQRNKKSYSIVLQHDIKGFSVDAVEEIILWGLSNGYTFLPLEMNSPICHQTVAN